MTSLKKTSKPSAQATTLKVLYGNGWVEIYIDNLALYRGEISESLYKMTDDLAKMNNIEVVFEEMDFK